MVRSTCGKTPAGSRDEKKLNKVSEKVALSIVSDNGDCEGRRRYGSGKKVDTFVAPQERRPDVNA